MNKCCMNCMQFKLSGMIRSPNEVRIKVGHCVRKNHSYMQTLNSFYGKNRDNKKSELGT